jgi:serine phosphatase RsbU (regulator of sigma subunit)
MKFLVVPPEGAPFERVFETDALVIGRSSSADLALPDPLLSRHHARLRREGGAVLVEDLGSRNGTFLNGRPLGAPAPLSPGDRISFGGSSLTVRGGEGPRVTIGPEAPSLEGTILRRASDLLGERSSLLDPAGGEGGLRKQAERLRTLNEVHAALGRPLALDELLGMILERAFTLLRPEQGVVFLESPGGGFHPVASRTLPGRGSDEIRLSKSLVAEVAEKGMAAIALDTATDERFAMAESIQLSGIRSLVAAPLLDGEKSLGMIVLSSTVAARRFSEEDLELLVSLASVAAMKIRNVALAEEAAERRRYEQELALARRIQEGLLPQTLPDLSGWSLLGRNVPSRVVSGDFYDIGTRNEGRELVVLVADVSGKGVAASLLTAALEALSEAPIDDGLPPEEVCHRLSRGIFRRTPTEKYATAFLVVVDVASGRLRYTNAGHNAGLLVRASGEVERFVSSGLPLGLFETPEYRGTDSALGPGDLLVLYTDGITEASDPEDDEYGIERLEKVVVANRELPIEELADTIERDVESFTKGVPFADDRTLVILGRLAGSEKGTSSSERTVSGIPARG